MGILVSFLFFLFYIHYFFVYWSCDHLTYILLIFGLYIDVCYSPISPSIVSFLFLYTCFLYLVCNLIFLFYTKMH